MDSKVLREGAQIYLTHKLTKQLKRSIKFLCIENDFLFKTSACTKMRLKESFGSSVRYTRTHNCIRLLEEDDLIQKRKMGKNHIIFFFKIMQNAA